MSELAGRQNVKQNAGVATANQRVDEAVRQQQEQAAQKDLTAVPAQPAPKPPTQDIRLANRLMFRPKRVL